MLTLLQSQRVPVIIVVMISENVLDHIEVTGLCISVGLPALHNLQNGRWE